MASCYRVPYSDRFGSHTATKWGETSDEARKLVAKSRGIDPASVGEPELISPQPFTRAVSALDEDVYL